MSAALRRRIARAIIIERASGTKHSLVDRIAEGRSEENYRFVARYVAGKTVLDIGGGTGIGHDILLKAGAKQILSLDKYVATGNKRTRGDSRIAYRKGDFTSAEIPHAPFDVVVCLGTLFFLSDLDAAIEKMRHLLTPGGILIVNCINDDLLLRFFGMRLSEIDTMFSRALGTAEFAALLKRHFGASCEFFVQQPVPIPRSGFGFWRPWATALSWPFGRHRVVACPANSAGMFNVAVAEKPAAPTA